jgi:hypothetical protein
MDTMMVISKGITEQITGKIEFCESKTGLATVSNMSKRSMIIHDESWRIII